MELKCRLTHNLVEIKVDEIETTLFKSHPKEIEDVIVNLVDIIDDLSKLINKNFSYTLTNVE
jgi:isopropylmalate/homocitrate/citramalate synthase